MKEQDVVRKISSYRKPFPEEHEERFAELVSSVSNSECKEATLLVLSETERKSSNDIRIDFFRRFKATPETHIPRSTTFSELCHNSLAEIGCVAEERVQKRNRNFGTIDVTTWLLTNEGKEFGTPLAYLGLKTALEMKDSLKPILGQTSSTEKSRAPYRRIRILEELEKEGRLREIDLEEIISGMVQYHLETLRDVGFVEYESVNLETKGWSIKKWVGDFDEIDKYNFGDYGLPTVKTIAFKYREAAEEGEFVDNNKIHRRLDKKFSLSTVSHVSFYLVKHGFLECHKYKGTEVQSEASITDTGKSFIENFVVPARRICEGEELDFSIPDNMVGESIELYFPHSNANRKTFEARYADFLNIYEAFDRDGFKGLRSGDFAKRCGIPKKSANGYFQKFYKRGLVTRKGGGKGSYYRPKEK